MNITDEESINSILDENIKLLKVSFNTKQNTLHLKFITRDELTKNSEQMFRQKLCNLVNLDIKYDIEIVRMLTNDELLNEVNKITESYKVGDKKLFTKTEIVSKNNAFVVNLYIDRENVNFTDLKVVEEKIYNLISESCIDEYYVNFQQISYKKETELLTKREELLFENADLSIFDENPTYKISDIDIISGRHIINVVRKISSIVKAEENILLAGRVKYFRQSYYVPKNATSETEQKIRYNFELQDFSGKISAVLFPNKEILQLENFELNDNDEIVVYCDSSTYNDKVSIRVKEIAKCKLPYEKQKESKQEEIIEQDINYITNVEENYKVVYPKAYIEEEQINLFSAKSETPILLKDKSFVVFDLETTGLEPAYCEIIEIGAVKVVNGEIVETFSTLLRPSDSIPDEITKLTGISDDMVVFSPTFNEVVADFYKFTRGSILVAHNANFDITFLRHHASKLKYNFDNEVQDTLAISRAKIKGLKNYKLKTLTEYFNVSLIGAHRAINDTVATAKVFIELCKLN